MYHKGNFDWPLRGPSIERMISELRITKAEAVEVKNLMREGKKTAAMEAANRAMKGFGVEAIFRHGGPSVAIEYVNMGDTYATTLIWDNLKGYFYIGSWGVFVELYGNKLGIE